MKCHSFNVSFIQHRPFINVIFVFYLRHYRTILKAISVLIFAIIINNSLISCFNEVHSLTSEVSPLFLYNTSNVHHVVLWQWMVTSRSLFGLVLNFIIMFGHPLQKFESFQNEWNQWHIHMIWMPSGLWILK